VASQGAIAETMAAFWPGYRVTGETIALGLAVTLAIGLASGAAPAWIAGRLRCVEALRPT
jgi:ABC-type antimicrobial peptide transport system permease subunit